VRSFYLLLAVTVASCSPTSDGGVTAMTSAGQLRISPAEGGADHDFLVQFPILRDFGFNTENRSDREALVNAALRQQCASINIIREAQIKSGQRGLSGQPNILYSEYVRCVSLQ
jgi:hypothetical protein